MGPIRKSRATLRLLGDSLKPAYVSLLLGCKPDEGHTKGEELPSYDGRKFYRRIGIWMLQAKEHKPENLNEQVNEILNKLTKDLNIWKKLSKRFKIDLYCGLFMKSFNEGVVISPKTLFALAERGIELGLDIYGPEKVKTITKKAERK